MHTAYLAVVALCEAAVTPREGPSPRPLTRLTSVTHMEAIEAHRIGTGPEQVTLKTTHQTSGNFLKNENVILCLLEHGML